VRVLFLNQYFPPDPAPTGLLLRDIGNRLEAAGWQVEYIDAEQDYRATRVGSRIKRELRALWTILVRGVRAPRPDIVFSASSPPLLLVVATLVAARHGARPVHWAMDLYPELAVALREIRPGVVSRIAGALMGWAYRQCVFVATLDADMQSRLDRYGVSAQVIRPWVTTPAFENEPEAPVSDWTWIYSGNLGRAHDWKTMLDAQAILERAGLPIRLRIQGGGPSRAAAESYARDISLRQCDWLPYVPERELRSSLLRCRAAVVTQLPAAQGLLWPSKLALLLSLPRWILWIGPTDGAIAHDLRQVPNAKVFAPGDAEGLARWVEAQFHAGAAPEPDPAIDAAAHRQRSLDRWSAILGITPGDGSAICYPRSHC
jgi:colanic acid biosynthesis glycosyl transferase WcaI